MFFRRAFFCYLTKAVLTLHLYLGVLTVILTCGTIKGLLTYV